MAVKKVCFCAATCTRRFMRQRLYVILGRLLTLFKVAHQYVHFSHYISV